jgi:hypothetical protein
LISVGIFNMRARGSGAAGFAAALLIWLGFPGYAAAGPPPNSQSHVEAAVENIAALERPGKDGLATFRMATNTCNAGACQTMLCAARRAAR